MRLYLFFYYAMQLGWNAYCISEDVHTHGDGESPPSAGLTPNALPEAQSIVSAESSHTGLSTRNAHLTKGTAKSKASVILKPQREEDIPQWYALRCTYGREQAAYDHLISKGIIAFYPTTNVVKLIKGKRKIVTESRLPNIFFDFGTETQLQTFVYDNVKLPYLRFYYRHEYDGRRIIKTPLIFPDYQMESLKIICAAEASDIIVSLSSVTNFQTDQLVRVIKGTFKGVIGSVKRWQGQQRVGVTIGEICNCIRAKRVFWKKHQFHERFL